MKHHSLLALFSVAVLALAGALVLADVAPATRPATAAVEISDEAQAVLERIDRAYAQLDSLDLIGTLTLRMDVSGQKTDRQVKTTGAYRAPGRFRHEAEGDVTVVGTGESVVGYDQERRLYAEVELKADQKGLQRFPSALIQIVQMQDPSLLLALSADAKQVLLEGVRQVRAEPDVTLDGTAYTALRLDGAEDSALLLVDPKTHLIRRLSLDMTPQLQKRDKGVKSAVLEFDYSRTTPDAEVPADRFVWQPPEGAREASVATADPSGLVGKSAPDFTLKDLDGKAVSLSDFKGQVLVLDFWATWCGPCVAAMPELEKVRADYEQKGVKVLTINQPPDTLDQVRAFMNERGLRLPVLMDSDFEVSKKYGVEALPTTVVIAQDGVVVRSIRGYVPGSGQKDLREAIEASLAGGSLLR